MTVLRNSEIGGKNVDFEHTKLVEFLYALEKKQLKDLLVFINLSGNELTPLQKKVFVAIIERLLAGKKLSEKNLLNQVVGKANISKWPKIKTYLLKVIYRYQKFIELEKEPFFGDYKLVQFFSQHRLTKNYKALFNSIEKDLKKNKLADDSLLENLSIILFDEFKIIQGKADRRKRSLEKIEGASFELDKYYLLHQLRLFCEIINRNLLIGNEPSISVDKLNFFLNFECDKVLIKIYQNILFLLTSPNENDKIYIETWELIQLSESEIPTKNLEDTIYLLVNFCLRAINKGKHHYVKNAWQHYKFLEDSDLLIRNETISPFTFLNIIVLGLKTKKMQWVKSYIAKNQIYIQNNKNNIKEDVIKLAEALYLFYNAKNIEDLNRCQNELKAFTANDNKLQILYEKLLLKIIFLSNDTKYCLQRIDWVKAKIERNNKMLAKEKIPVFNFLNALKKICLGKELNIKRADYHFLDYDWLVENCKKGNR